MANDGSLFERITNRVNHWANWVACGAAFAMMALVCSDVIMRALGHPFKGPYDIVGLLSVVLVAFSMAYTQVKKRHTSVSFVLSHLSPRAQNIMASVTTAVGFVLFIMVTGACLDLAKRHWENGEVTMTLEIPVYPLTCIVALGCALMCLVLFSDLLQLIKKAVRG